MILQFPDFMPVKSMVELGQIYWGYPGQPKVNMRIMRDGKTSVFNLAHFITNWKADPAAKVHTKGMAMDVDDEEIGIWIRLKYL